MSRLLTVPFFAFVLAACVEVNSQPQPVVTVPAVSAAASQPPPEPAAPVDAGAAVATVAAEADAAAGAAESDPPEGVGAQFRSCTADADCVAVERLACCPNGRKVAVAAAQKDAYRQSFTCEKKRRMCPQYRMLDPRVAFCDTSAKLCSMKNP